MFGTRGYRIGMIAGSLALAAFLGTASAQTTKDVTAGKSIKVRDGYTYTFRPTDKVFGIRDYTFFNAANHKDLTFLIYKDNSTAIDSYFRELFASDGIESDYKGFTDEVVAARDLKLYNFVTDFWVPQRFISFANVIEHAFGIASKDAGYTLNVTGKKADQFFFNYFTNNSAWSVDDAFAAFKRDFSLKDDQITYATFRDYIFVPGLLRYFGKSYVAGVKAGGVNKE